ncbi:2Fe-2S iron-sulfur cluster binding domain-containing protein [Acidiphilium sp. AL]|uniref:2Fe-2S iron-sulfur cluster binding domain-containing protein n=1 Tax=Acidiphilium sp. AL TaxID=2871704 RepID=UPI0021CB183F|nr:2Fe-2S iron-sulfur cluster-binding protein [Acidiphilium sp. AL]MCU4160517.1 2Fe-2S iron-sulfur cluster binding domain-containing protein [Acidiphilium sp. AL]
MTHCIRITTASQSREFEAEPGERVLHAALRAGVMLPYECATGSCGTCRATVTNGNVASFWPDAPGGRKLRGASDILTCQTAATGDLELSIRGSIGRVDNVPAHLHGRMTQRRRHNEEIAEFSVELDRPMHFIAGQFVLMEFSGIPGPRAYSMTNRPGVDTKSPRFLIRDTGTGLVTRRLFDSSPLDEPVRLFGPLGRATYDPAEHRPFVAIAGGSGIAGILSILDHAVEVGHFADYPSQLVFGLRAPNAAYLLDRLSAYARRFAKGLAIVIAFSDGPPDTTLSATHPALRFFHGFAHDAARGMLVPGDAKPIHYVAGPPLMVDATLRMLMVEQKISPGDVRYDRFD